MSPKQTNWYLRKPNGSEYGPVTTSELQRWAAQCRIVAGNGVSSDRETWQHVEDIPELEMDWIAHRPDGGEYGPFNIAATRELFEHDVLPEDALLTHRTTNKTVTVQQVLNKADHTATTTPAKTPPPAKKEEKDVNKEKPQAVTPEAQEKRTPVEPIETESAPLAVEDTSAKPETTKESPEVANLKTQLEKLQERLKTAQADLRQVRKELDNANAETVEITTSLQVECKEATEALSNLQQEMEVMREQHLTKTKALSLELTAAQTAFDEATKARKQAEAKQATLDAERSEAEQQALQSTGELRKQTAFMKKNNATLQCELEAARTQASKRGRWLIIILALLALVGAALLLIPPSIGKRIPVAEMQRDDIAPTHSTMGPTHNTAPAEAMPELAVAPTRQPLSTQATTPRPPPLDQSTPAAPWPTLMVEGIKMLPENDVCRIRFDSGVFTRLTTPSSDAVTQLMEIADSLRPKLDQFQLIVEGHTDDKPLKRSAAYDGNYALGLARAEAIRALLITKGKLPANAIQTVSAGGKRSPYPNDTLANQTRNRTVILKLVRK